MPRADFTEKERKIIRLKAQGRVVSQIAQDLTVSKADVCQTLKRIANKIKGIEDSITVMKEMGVLKETATIELTVQGKKYLEKINTQREVLAKAIHEKYLKDQEKNKPSSDPSMQPWDKLNEDLKESNRRQADHIPEKLRKIGYGFAPVIGRKPEVIEFNEQELEIIAEEEHKRWVSDLQTNGWVFKNKKDIARKHSPYLVEWNKLSNDAKEYDRQAMRAMPELLAKAKFQILKLTERQNETRILQKNKT